MRIVFWGSERGSNVTSNMIILAGFLACHRGYRITLLEWAKERQGLQNYFPETCSKREETYIQTIVERQLYYICKENWETYVEHKKNLPKSQEAKLLPWEKKGRRRPKKYKKTGEPLPAEVKLIRYLESNMDMVFINLADRTDDRARELMKNADMVVVNFKQEQRAFDRFYAHYGNLSARMFLLIGNYIEDGACDKAHLQEKYKIPAEQLAIIPNNPEYQMACDRGRLDRYIRRNRAPFLSIMKAQFLKEVENTVEQFYENVSKYQTQKKR